MQHPIARKSISELNMEEQESAYGLLKMAVEITVDENYTQIDYIQMARITYTLGELANILDHAKEDVYNYYSKTSHYLVKGGIDLSINKWMEILSLRTTGE